MEAIINKMIDSMDNETIFLAYGDHGMTDGGNHGGNSEEELRTVLFAYSKAGLPMKRLPERVQKIFAKLQPRVK